MADEYLSGNVRISIHATLAGGDYYTGENPTINRYISIHATLAGGDDAMIAMFFLSAIFLSTPPSRVATQRHLQRLPGELYFYPRHPRGWRHDYISFFSNLQ